MDDTLGKTPVNRIQLNAHELIDIKGSYQPLMAQVGDSSLVLIGEATHGTHEFYQARAEITRRLIQEKGFTIVAVEADWPDAYRINRYVQERSDDRAADEALSDIKRFPTWMWRYTVVRDFVEWLREYNQAQPAAERYRGNLPPGNRAYQPLLHGKAVGTI
jgi:erythromycin esterase-like protein